MKKIINVVAAVVIVTALFFVSGAAYIVTETQQVVITQFGMPIGEAVDSAGLHFKIPFIQNANYFEKRLLEWDGDPNQIPTRDKKYIWVDTTARWKIVDPLKFFQSVGNEWGAHARLDDIINSATRDVITGDVLVEVIRDSNRILETEVNQDIGVMTISEEALERIYSGRKQLEADILARSAVIAPQYGIEIVDVRVKRLNYVDEVRKRVYDRMISERKRAAEMYRSEGRGRSADIKGQMERELKSITSGAYKTSQEILGEADAQATSIYADAYNRDPDFYSFLKTLDTYGVTIDPTTTVILTTDADYYKYLKSSK
ncbi:MAG: protease modulator HflC [Candidatus Tantalella remota]|nr:protease modulator HflC [Candidatus Tantalella remota]